MSAVPSKASAAVGTVVPVNGRVLGPPVNCPVLLQRLYGASQWRQVSAAKVRLSGRYTVTAQPAYKGLIPYRVYFAACQRHYLTGVSPTFYSCRPTSFPFPTHAQSSRFTTWDISITPKATHQGSAKCWT